MFYSIMKYVIMILFIGMIVIFNIATESSVSSTQDVPMQQSGPKFNF